MTAYLAGLAHIRCAEHPRADKIDGVARAVLVAMAYPCSEDNPRCRLSHASIASRSGFGRMTVIRAQERLAELGLIERVPTPIGHAAQWALTLLRDPHRTADLSQSGTPPLSQSGTPPVPERDTPCTAPVHKPSDLSPTPREERR